MLHLCSYGHGVFRQGPILIPCPADLRGPGPRRTGGARGSFPRDRRSYSGDSLSYKASAIDLLGPRRSSCRVVLFKGEPNTDECLMEDPDRLKGICTEEADGVEGVGREGVVEIEGYLLTREPTFYPAVSLEALS
jgi:hypothetical protein